MKNPMGAQGNDGVEKVSTYEMTSAMQGRACSLVMLYTEPLGLFLYPPFLSCQKYAVKEAWTSSLPIVLLLVLSSNDPNVTTLSEITTLPLYHPTQKNTILHVLLHLNLIL